MGELHLEKITFRYPKQADLLFRELSLTFHQDEAVAILGRSGCGKTTLLKLLAGLLEPTAGSLLENGQPQKGASLRRGLLFQTPRLFPWLTVQQNIELALEQSHPEMSQVEKKKRISDWLELVGLSRNLLNVLPQELSEGMRQRVSLIRSLVAEPVWLMMDEPFSAQDDQTKKQIQRELFQCWETAQKEGFAVPTLIFVTHDLGEADRLASRQITLGGRPCQLLSDEGGLPFESVNHSASAVSGRA